MNGQLILIIKLIDILSVAIVTMPELLRQFNELRKTVQDMVEHNVDPTRTQINEILGRAKTIEDGLAARLAVLESGEVTSVDEVSSEPLPPVEDSTDTSEE